MQQRPGRLRRPMKTVDEKNLPSTPLLGTLTTNSSEHRPSSYEFGPGDSGAGVQEGMSFHAHSPTSIEDSNGGLKASSLP